MSGYRFASNRSDAELAERIRYLTFMKERKVIKWPEQEELDECLREQAERDYKKELRP